MEYKIGYGLETSNIIYWQTGFRPEEDIHYHGIHLYKDGRLVIDENYACDGVSFFPFKKVKVLIRAAVIHDALSELMRNKLLSSRDWKKADREMYLVAVNAGAYKWFAKSVVKGLSLAQGYYTNPKQKRKIHHAP